jgi:hypothetical protein
MQFPYATCNIYACGAALRRRRISQLLLCGVRTRHHPCTCEYSPCTRGYTRVLGVHTVGYLLGLMPNARVQHSTLDSLELHHHLAKLRQKLSLHILDGREWAVQFDPAQGTHLASDVAELNFPVYLFNILNEASALARIGTGTGPHRHRDGNRLAVAVPMRALSDRARAPHRASQCAAAQGPLPPHGRGAAGLGRAACAASHPMHRRGATRCRALVVGAVVTTGAFPAAPPARFAGPVHAARPAAPGARL